MKKQVIQGPAPKKCSDTEAKPTFPTDKRSYFLKNERADPRSIKKINFRTHLKSILKSCRDYISQFMKIESMQPGIDINEATGTPSGVNFKISFRKPSRNEHNSGIKSIEYLYDLLQKSLESFNFSLWLAVDKLDVAFTENQTLETNALRTLVKTYRDLAPFDRIKIKIFLRNDIWRRIVKEGFREASHINNSRYAFGT